MTSATRLRAILLDVDGTLVDSNDAHADAWVQAFAEHGVTVSRELVRASIGMGGDKLMPRVSSLDEESSEGKAISTRRGEIFVERYVPTLRALAGSSDLVAALKARGFTVVAASSAKENELDTLLKIAGVDTLLDHATSTDDAEQSKPDPDIVHAALHRAGASAPEAVMIGDTPYDIEAASKAEVKTIAFRSGGWRDEDLQGAIAIYDGPADLLAQLDTSPLAR